MRITKINNTQIYSKIHKTKFTSSLKTLHAKGHIIADEAFDAFEKSYKAKERELFTILNKKNIASNGLASELAKYEGDDYKFAKIMTENIQNAGNHLEINVDKKTLAKIKALQVECPILKSWQQHITK